MIDIHLFVLRFDGKDGISAKNTNCILILEEQTNILIVAPGFLAS